MSTNSEDDFNRDVVSSVGENRGISAADLWSFLTRRYRLIIACTLAAGFAALAFSLLQEKQYEASSSLLFRESKFGLNIFGETSSSPPQVDEERQAATDVELANQDEVRALTAEAMGDGFTSQDVASQVEASESPTSNLVEITATDSDPETARDLADSYAAAVVEYRTLTDRRQILSSKRQVDRLLETGNDTTGEQAILGDISGDLATASDQLAVLAKIQTGNVEVVQPATLPTDYSTPKIARNTVVGLLAGLLIGLFAAFMAERLDRRLRSPDDVDEAYGLPVLGVIPETEDIVVSNQGGTGMQLPFAVAEAFRMIRASLRYFNVDQETRVVMVASEVPQEGKSTVSWNLANVAALSGSALLIETDLRRPSLSNQHGINPTPGLAEYLTRQVGLDQVIQSRSASGENGNGEGPSLDIITAGTPPPNPSELLESNSMGEFLNEVRSKYDLVVIDTPPIGVVSDALALAQHVDGVLIVSRLDKTTRDSAARLKQRLMRSRVNLLGTVANGLRSSGRGGYQGGYYGAYNLDIDYSSQAPAAAASEESKTNPAAKV